jgi:DNA-binding XRE family transcriptional regulator
MNWTIKRPTFSDFKKKALQNDDVRKEYNALKPLFTIKKQLVAARISKGFTQEEIAKRIGTSKSNISRLESPNNTYMPNLATLVKYAEALGMRLDIGLK